MKEKIVFTGGSGRFGKVFKKIYEKKKFKVFFPSSKILNILKLNSIKKYLFLKRPKYLIHSAALSRPMKIHDENISKSIDTNIIGTANIVKVCEKLNIKLIFISTSYVYPGTKNNYKENSPINPINNYGLSKMGGEASVRMYKNSLIVRASMTEKPFVHKYAFNDFITNFIYHEDFVKLLMHLLDCKGIINVGGKSQTVYSFALANKIKLKKKSAKSLLGINSKINLGMNIDKLNNILKLKGVNL